MKENIIQLKSFTFSIKIISIYKHLIEEKKEFILSKQVLKSGTSIGANIEEAIGGQSKADFIHKISIAYKETRETVYWLKLLSVTNYLAENIAQELILDAEEICRIIGSIQRTLKSNSK